MKISSKVGIAITFGLLELYSSQLLVLGKVNPFLLEWHFKDSVQVSFFIFQFCLETPKVGFAITSRLVELQGWKLSGLE